MDYGCTAEITLGFADRKEFNRNIMVLKKLAEHVIKVELVLCIKTAKGEAIRSAITRSLGKMPYLKKILEDIYSPIWD